MERIKVLLVEDHPVFLDGLATLIRVKCPDIQIVGLARNGKEALARCQEQRPHIVLMDLRMPEMNGMEATARLKQEYPEVKVIALTTFDDEEYIVGALESGANGYILKNAPWQEIVRAVHTVYEGGILIAPEVANKLAQRFRKETVSSQIKQQHQQELQAHGIFLSMRDKELLYLMAQGKDNREIAMSLFLNDRTVRNYLSRLYEHIGVRSRAEAAIWAVEHGYGKPEEGRDK